MRYVVNPFRKLFILSLLIFCSCASITEEIYLNEDGSGEYLVYTDIIGSSRAMMAGMMNSLYPNASEDSINQIVDTKIWDQFPTQIDSIMDISSQIPDSIKNNPEKRRYLDKMEMYMKGGKKEGFINSGMRYQFSNVEELEKLQDFLNENQSATNQGMQMDVPNVKVNYSFDGSSFSRRANINEMMEMSDSTMMVLGSLLEGSKSKLIIHLPAKVKKASKNQLVKKSGKDVLYEYDLISVISGKQSTDIDIKF
ncbi:MAG: hypothetical protein AAFY41_02205 [Bacteroidota bacterium]